MSVESNPEGVWGSAPALVGPSQGMNVDIGLYESDVASRWHQRLGNLPGNCDRLQQEQAKPDCVHAGESVFHTGEPLTLLDSPGMLGGTCD